MTVRRHFFLTKLSKKGDGARGVVYIGRMPRRPEAKAKILETALLLFWQKGPAAVSMDEVGRAAGVHKGSLYHYHRDRDALALAVVDEMRSRTGEVLGRAREIADPRTRLLHYFDTVARLQGDIAREHGQFPACPIATMAADAPGDDPVLRAATESVFRDILGLIDEVLAELRPGASKRARAAAAEDLLIVWEGAQTLAGARNEPTPFKRARALTIKLLEAWTNSG